MSEWWWVMIGWWVAPSCKMLTFLFLSFCFTLHFLPHPSLCSPVMRDGWYERNARNARNVRSGWVVSGRESVVDHDLFAIYTIMRNLHILFLFILRLFHCTLLSTILRSFSRRGVEEWKWRVNEKGWLIVDTHALYCQHPLHQARSSWPLSFHSVSLHISFRHPVVFVLPSTHLVHSCTALWCACLLRLPSHSWRGSDDMEMKYYKCWFEYTSDGWNMWYKNVNNSL